MRVSEKRRRRVRERVRSALKAVESALMGGVPVVRPRRRRARQKQELNTSAR
jgi:hypothetical protein